MITHFLHELQAYVPTKLLVPEICYNFWTYDSFVWHRIYHCTKKGRGGKQREKHLT
jgi:hypothetical protein